MMGKGTNERWKQQVRSGQFSARSRTAPQGEDREGMRERGSEGARRRKEGVGRLSAVGSRRSPWRQHHHLAALWSSDCERDQATRICRPLEALGIAASLRRWRLIGHGS